MEQAVRDGVVRMITLQHKGAPYVFDVYAEADIQLAIANHKFQTKVDVEDWG